MRRSTRGCAPNLLCEVSTVALSPHKSDGGLRWMFRRSFAAVATSREDHRQPGLDRLHFMRQR